MVEERRHSDELIHDIDKKLAVLCSEFTSLKFYVMGNGKKGLGDRVRALEGWRWYIGGGLALGGFLVVVWLKMS